MGYFRAFIKDSLRFDWRTGLALILIFGIPRFITVLHASKTGDYRFTSIIFVAMWILPFLLLTKLGRKEIGLKKPTGFIPLLWAFLVGGLVCLGVWLIGTWLYADTVQNWMVYISQSYQVPSGPSFEALKFQYFMVFATMGMLFSPIGEEFLYRGLIHRCFSEGLGDNKASLIDSLAFGVTHLAHFGILFIDGKWMFSWVPAFLWVLFMFSASRVFFMMKRKSYSLWGAVICHAGFNLAMTYFIFYYVF
ncbi:CPBP family intramembrane metalloprotease [Muricauda sp. JGD-17]|uniref:CPBP family intramembrane metalloprotease n=1 Tax=Flagellimonas ochracea TaxID=2696472 RepID=A0A964TEV5_9FLAO|nr:CPBP family intramembrane glutamic endopeptidase [Allomuricauda ochracea]NAY92901.1 CPBP family intramembrane metalloprotease [Allomuricauda ochracea]